MSSILFVGLGGATGAVARYLISLIPLKNSFPFLTLVTNLLGAVLIGFAVGVYGGKGMGEKGLLFWKTGVCGGFTTFSAFSLESLGLLEDKKYLLGILYILGSVVLCIAGVALGRYIALKTVKNG